MSLAVVTVTAGVVSTRPSTETRPSAIQRSASPKFFVADPGADNVYRYTSSGASSGFFPTDPLESDVRGIAANAAGNTLWQIDASTHAVVVGGPTGTLKGFWTAKYETTQGLWKRIVGPQPGYHRATFPDCIRIL